MLDDEGLPHDGTADCLASGQPGLPYQCERAGLLGTVAPASFTLTDSDSNAQEVHAYSEVGHVSRSREYIGEGSVHHFFRPWVPVAVGVLAAGAAVTAFELH